MSTAEKKDVDFHDLIQIKKDLLSQDNRMTAHPMFCVQEEIKVYGMDTRWNNENNIWIDTEDGISELPKPKNAREYEQYQQNEFYEETGVHRYWKTVMVAFTEKGCEEYLQQNGHNHHGETRIYVESYNRCPEMIAIRGFLMSNEFITILETKTNKLC